MVLNRLNAGIHPAGRWRIGKTLLVAGMLLLASGADAWAEECRVLAERMLERHPRLEAAKRDALAAKANVGKVRGGWFPDMKTSGAMGSESRKPANGGTPTDMNARTLTMTLNQALWDFGKTNAEVTKANLALLQAELNLTNQRADLLLDAASSCINLLRTYRALAFAEQSVANIRKQTGLEESRVELGGGLQTDALQARSQLSGAQAREARAKGALNTALNHFRVLFDGEPNAPETLYELQNPTEHLPDTLDKVLENVLNHNLQLQIAQVAVTTSQMEKNRVIGAELAPKVGAVVEKKYKEDAEGTKGNQQELAARVEVSYPFNLGLAGFHALEGAREGIAAADNRLLDTRHTVEEQARNGWESITTTQENANFLENQARISAEFLRMAREERLHGARSLIDVLSGETALINAQSDALAAKADVAIAQFGLLKTMGLLNLELLNRGERFVLPKVDALETPAKPTSTPPSAPTPSASSQPSSANDGRSTKANATPPAQGEEQPSRAPRSTSPASEAPSTAPATPASSTPPEASTPPARTVTLIHNARLRSGPNQHAKVIKRLPAGSSVTVVEESPDGGHWLRLDDDLWISARMVTDQSKTQSKTQSEDVPPPTQQAVEKFPYQGVVNTVSRLRLQPDVHGKTLKILHEGTQVTVMNRSEDGLWLQLDSEAWIASSLVKPL
ncbi:MAG: TolC family protein [Magnetococcales bacterium]|nr:TolC family protein [Magnetococcales bacterium]